MTGKEATKDFEIILSLVGLQELQSKEIKESNTIRRVLREEGVSEKEFLEELEKDSQYKYVSKYLRRVWKIHS
jgi:ribosome biogenesis protein Nip4